jgi:hypoxanthine phosphoribosyltransferase
MMSTNKAEVNTGIPVTIDANTSREDRIRYENSSVVYNQAQIEPALAKMARSIEAYYRDIGQRPVIIVVLNGGKKTTEGLIKYFSPEFQAECEFDSVHASCYRDGENIGEFYYKKRLGHDPTGKHLLYVDDLIDTATTLTRLTEDAMAVKEEERPADVKTAVLFDKQIFRKESNLQAADFSGLFVKAGLWLYGFGMNRGFDGETVEDEELTRDLNEVRVAHGQPTLTAAWNLDWKVMPYAPRPDALNFLLDMAKNNSAQNALLEEQKEQCVFQG